MENEIQLWLQGPRDYAQGRTLFEKYSSKKPLINLFRRKCKPEVLLYNLQKLIKTSLAVAVPVIQPVKTASPINDAKKVIIKDEFNYEDLPDNLKKRHDQIREFYKHMRSYHEKLKLANTDDERQQLRKILIEYDDAITENWKQIDNWNPGEQESVMTDTNPESEIAAAKKYLSANVKYLSLRQGVKQQQLLFLIQEKIEILQINKVKVSKTVVDELLKIGINI